MKRVIRAPYFEIGTKNYIYGDKVLEYAIAADKAAEKYDIDVLFICPAVEIRQVSNTLVGTAPELIRHLIEIRGIGIIEIQKLFGMGAVQFETEIDLVIQLEQWVDGKFYDRLGLGEDSYTMLGVSLPYVTIPVRPGRNLAGIVELATMKNRQMNSGGDSALDFIARFDQRIDELTQQTKENG